MKTVSIEIRSSTPVTTSKAASVLSKFLSAETGASQAVNAYLGRAAASLDELVRLHSKSHRKKHKKLKSDSSAVTAAITNGEIPTRSIEVSQEPTTGFENGRKKGKIFDDEGRTVNKVEGEKSQGEGSLGKDTERKKHKKEKSGDSDGGSVGVKIREEQTHAENKLGEETERKKHKKKSRSGNNLGDSVVNGVGIGNGEVENKRGNKEEEKTVDNIGEHEEDGLKMKIGEPKKEHRKKRKNIEVEDGSWNESEEQPSKKKKRRRGGEDAN